VIVVGAPFRRSVWFLIFNILLYLFFVSTNGFPSSPLPRREQALSSANIDDCADIGANAGLTAENIFGGEEIKN
jgi:hypothetical protein